MSVTPEFLKQFEPFDRFSLDILNKAIEKIRLHEFAKGTIVFRRGKALDDRYYLVSGQIDLVNSAFERYSLIAETEEAFSPINMESPTQVSAVAANRVTCFSIPTGYLEGLIAADSEEQQDESVDARDWMSLFLQQPLFMRLPPANIQQLFFKLQTRKVKAGETIVRQDEEGDCFYVIEAGDAQVINRQGEVLADLIPGDYFGEEALVGGTRRNASVVMRTAGRVKFLDKADFIALLQEPVLRRVTTEEYLKAPAKYQIVDVRLAIERHFGSVAQSVNIPLMQVRSRLAALRNDASSLSKHYLITDDGGPRAAVAVQLFVQAGFEASLLVEASQLYPIAP